MSSAAAYQACVEARNVGVLRVTPDRRRMTARPRLESETGG